jgi:predicted Fe-Mo cluster-binding NifX family protein
MRLCLPTVHDLGHTALLSEHFGSAPYFTFVDSESGATEVIPNHHAEHTAGSCDAARTIAGYGVDAVLCLGLGRRALANLGAAGIPVFFADVGTVSGAVEAFTAGRLRRMDAQSACAGGFHHHCS